MNGTLRHPKRSQRGLSLFSVAFMLAFLALVMVIVVKVFPIYAANMTIRNSIEGTLAANDIEEIGETAFRREAMKSIDQSNGIRDFDSQNIMVTREGSNLYLDVNYEKREHLFYNIDVVIVFENRFDIR